ncbi:hypothetical protein DUI87_22166 [Hirundo rustica rustica]|uniref:Uncharacterized protein n=1 Tax=Hirundo rustica rustica TaxID=333673 RepID=A0A3M0K264_HIRRU|nr:hypothetical protein DUI87_22166 [Hirundo rustica rustica]
MDQEWACAVDEELSPWADVSGRELCLWEEVTAPEFREWEEEVALQEISPHRAAGHPELHHQHIGVRMQGADVGQQELSQWGESEMVQGLQQWDEDEYDRCQELSPWEGWGCQELCPTDEDVQVQWEEVKRDLELGQVGVKRYRKQSQGKDASLQDLVLWGTYVNKAKLSREEARVSSLTGLSPWGESVSDKLWDKALPTKKVAQSSAQQGPSSPSSRGTKATAAARAAEEPPEPLAAKGEKAPGSADLGQEPQNPELSEGEMNQSHEATTGEADMEPELLQGDSGTSQ